MSSFISKVIAGHPVQTRNGKAAKFIAYVPALKYYKFVFCVSTFIHTVDKNGHFNKKPPHMLDIILAPQQKN